MNVLVIGAGKVGFYLCKTLKEHRHTPTLIDNDREACSRCADALGIKVIHGDGSTIDAMEQAGILSDGIQNVIAVTGSDEDNLIACQIAKLHFHVSKTIARINNPRNLDLAPLFQVDIPICGTLNIANMLERQVDAAAIKQILSLNRGQSIISEIQLPETGWPLDGTPIQELTLPPESNIICITRGDDFIIPRGHIRLKGGDQLLVLVNRDAAHDLSHALQLEKA